MTLVLYRRRAPDKKRGEKQSVGARVLTGNSDIIGLRQLPLATYRSDA